MSAPDLLVVVDPAARHLDGESVRIARDVLGAGAPGVKVCLPQNREGVARAVARRGRRRPVVVGDDRALLCAVEQLHRERTAADGARPDGPGARGAGRRGAGGAPVPSAVALGMVPVGPGWSVALAWELGLPLDVVTAARAVLAGTERPLDLLVDDAGGVVLGGLRIPAGRAAPAAVARFRDEPHDGWYDGWYDGPRDDRSWDGRYAGARDGGLDDARGDSRNGGRDGSGAARATGAAPSGVLGSLGRRASRVWQCRRPEEAPLPRLRVEADGVVLAEPARPVAEVSVSTGPGGAGGGLAEVVVRRGPAGGDGSAATASLVRVTARAVTVSGPEFRARTWTVHPSALRLTVPAG
ncbi:hypothetical protein V1J52_17110 [Streptomyces sp. TRM 70351]|uniref:hypothetical protein n=1 Tax=Streptomyces sp. TRM 70351 TaxID=3116552 RepID=UPI002E7B0FF5|nr:hypothetical protein [Streptomyces sp. TRM 70351]MEE1929879.1 hypothetical protein [Streptomyces sp. TRM 70351]